MLCYVKYYQPPVKTLKHYPSYVYAACCKTVSAFLSNYIL